MTHLITSMLISVLIPVMDYPFCHWLVLNYFVSNASKLFFIKTWKYGKVNTVTLGFDTHPEITRWSVFKSGKPYLIETFLWLSSRLLNYLSNAIWCQKLVTTQTVCWPVFCPCTFQGSYCFPNSLIYQKVLASHAHLKSMYWLCKQYINPDAV